MISPSTTPDFNFIAPVYDRLAKVVFGDTQQKAQGHFLYKIPVGARVLVIGGGSGEILIQLLQNCSPYHVLYLEASPVMLQKARQRTEASVKAPLVEFRLGTENQLHPQELFDIVITPFLLDLFPDSLLTTLIQKLNSALLPNGLWLHTDFRLAPSTKAQLWQKPLLWAMYRFFGVLSNVQARQLPSFEQHFRQVGLVPIASTYYYRAFIEAMVFQKP